MTSYNFRYHGEDDDRVSVASRKMTSYAKTDCVGASKGLFFGLLTLVSGLICLILFFVLIDHDNQQVRPLGALKKDLMKDVLPKKSPKSLNIEVLTLCLHTIRTKVAQNLTKKILTY